MSGSNPGLLSIVFWPHPLFAKGAPPCATPGVGIVTQDHRETHTSPAGFLTLGGGSRPVQLFPAHPSPRCHLGCSICEEVCREFTSFLPVSCCTSWATKRLVLLVSRSCSFLELLCGSYSGVLKFTVTVVSEMRWLIFCENVLNKKKSDDLFFPFSAVMLKQIQFSWKGLTLTISQQCWLFSAALINSFSSFLPFKCNGL